MNSISYFFWLAGESLALLMIFPPAGLLMLAGVVVAIARVPSIPEERRKDAVFAVLLPMILPVLILLIGVGLVHDPKNQRGGGHGAELVIDALLFAHLPLALLISVRLEGARWFAVAASATIFGYSLGAAFMSTMSVTGLWL